MPIAPFEAAIFDMDGLLIDSEPLWRRAEIEIFGGLGVPLTEEMCSQTMGLRIDEVVSYWYERFPWPETGQSQTDIAAANVEKVRQLMESEAMALPGVHALIGNLKEAGRRIALASSSPPILIETTIQQLGLKEAFEILSSAQDEQLGKPHPAVYLTTARKLDIAPSLCLAFEDSVAGMRSALAAGMQVVVVPAPEEYGRREFDDAHLKLRSLEEFRLEG